MRDELILGATLAVGAALLAGVPFTRTRAFRAYEPLLPERRAFRLRLQIFGWALLLIGAVHAYVFFCKRLRAYGGGT